jgi:hypothetical protein
MQCVSSIKKAFDFKRFFYDFHKCAKIIARTDQNHLFILNLFILDDFIKTQPAANFHFHTLHAST